MKSRHLSYKTKLTSHFSQYASTYIFTIVLFSIGVVFGAIVVNSLSFSQKEDLLYYLNEFFSLVLAGDVTESRQLFLQSFFHNSKMITLIWILGLSVIGLPLILILLFLKGIVVGFTVGFLVNQLGLHGFFLSFLAILPQNLVIVPVFIICTTISIVFSFKMIRKQFMKTADEIGPILIRYFYGLLALIALVVISATIEAYVSPFLMKILLPYIN